MTFRKTKKEDIGGSARIANLDAIVVDHENDLHLAIRLSADFSHKTLHKYVEIYEFSKELSDDVVILSIYAIICNIRIIEFSRETFVMVDDEIG